MQSLAEKFEAGIDRGGPIHPLHGQCWVWRGKTMNTGYGFVIHRGASHLTHRVSLLYFGKVNVFGSRDCALHRCDNRLCINPDHLFVGTRQDNNEDKRLKGRHSFGEKNGRAKLTTEDVQQVRRLFARGLCSKSELSRMFGVCHSVIRKIISRKLWPSVS